MILRLLCYSYCSTTLCLQENTKTARNSCRARHITPHTPSLHHFKWNDSTNFQFAVGRKKRPSSTCPVQYKHSLICTFFFWASINHISRFQELEALSRFSSACWTCLNGWNLILSIHFLFWPWNQENRPKRDAKHVLEPRIFLQLHNTNDPLNVCIYHGLTG